MVQDGEYNNGLLSVIEVFIENYFPINNDFQPISGELTETFGVILTQKVKLRNK